MVRKPSQIQASEQDVTLDDACADPPGDPSAAQRTGISDRNKSHCAGPIFRAGLLLTYAVMVAARMPEILLKGRFWAEEGAVYFLNARNLPWYEALFAVHTGYLNLAASIATLLAARVVPIEQAPWVSTALALLVQLCPPLLLLTSGITWLRNRWAVAAALLLLLATARSGEVWMNSITSQFHLALCAGLILAMPVCRGATGVFRNALLVFAPLSGPTAAFLAPWFIVRGFFDASWQRLSQGMLLGCAGAVQALVILQNPEPGRVIGIGPRLLALVVYIRHILLPLLGTSTTESLAQRLTHEILDGRTPWVPFLVSSACMAAMAVAAWRSRNAEVRWLLTGGAVIMTMSYFGALGQHIDLLGPQFGERYSYTPNALYGLALLGIALTTRGWPKAIPALLVCWVIWTGMHEYFQPDALMANGSSWRTEIAHWRADPSYRVRFWPDTDAWRWWILPVPAQPVR